MKITLDKCIRYANKKKHIIVAFTIGWFVNNRLTIANLSSVSISKVIA